MNDANKVEPKKSVIKDKIVPSLLMLLAVAITVGLFLFAKYYPDQLEQFKTYGYVGVFVICLVSNATVILPVPGIFIFIPLLGTLNPVLVGLVGAAAGTIGEVTGYMAGYSGHGIVSSKKLFTRIDYWMKKWGFWTVFTFAIAPFLPVDVAGMVAGALRFSFWKFLVAVWIGKSIKYVVLMLLGVWGLQVLLRYFG